MLCQKMSQGGFWCTLEIGLTLQSKGSIAIDIRWFAVIHKTASKDVYMKYELVVGLKDVDQEGETEAITESVSGDMLPDTAMYLIYIQDGYTPISVSGSELTNGHSGEYKFKDGMMILRVN
jgi:hypothetical protein